MLEMGIMDIINIVEDIMGIMDIIAITGIMMDTMTIGSPAHIRIIDIASIANQYVSPVTGSGGMMNVAE
mgnify:FL=1